MTNTAKLFTHGRSQAVRLPKAYCFAGAEVRITRVRDRVIFEPLSPGSVPWDEIDRTGDNPFMPEGRDQPPLPDDPPPLA